MTKTEMPAAVEDHFRKLAFAFKEQALCEADTLRELGDSLLSASGYEAREAALSAIRVLTHRLAGRGGTFGFPTISTAASAVEQAIDDVLPQISTMSPDALAHIQPLLQSLCGEISSLEARSASSAAHYSCS